MKRYLIVALCWMFATFAMLWWVQVAAHETHRRAVESMVRVNPYQPPAPITGDAEAAVALAKAMKASLDVPGELERLEADHRELMQRVRMLWVVTALVPLLVGAWWALRETGGGGGKIEREAVRTGIVG